MKLKLDITPDIVGMMAVEIRAGEKAVTAATREAGNTLKSAWRAQITGAGLGQRLARTIRSEQFPRGKPSFNAAALVWSNAPVIVRADCDTNTSTCRSTAPISAGLCFFRGIPSSSIWPDSLLQGGTTFQGAGPGGMFEVAMMRTCEVSELGGAG